MKIALIIGGTGQIGVYLAHQLLKKKYKVFISSRKITNHKKNKFKIINIYKKHNIMNKELRDAIKTIIREKLANSPAPAQAPSKPAQTPSKPERETIPGAPPSEKPRRTLKPNEPNKLPDTKPAKAVRENEMDIVKKIVNRFKSIR